MAIQILMPALSPTMEEGKLSKWLVKEGDAVKSGDILAEIETDKATMEFEAVDEGRVGKILVAEGTEGVKVNTPIATLLAEGDDAGAVPDISSAMNSIKEAVKAETKTKIASPLEGEAASRSDAVGGNAKSPTTPSLKGGGEGRVFASPLARKIAAQRGIDIASIAGSGPHGRIVKADLEGAKPVAAPVAASAGVSGIAPLPDARLFYKPDDYVEIPNDMMRRSIAKRLGSAAALIPHVKLTTDCKLDALLAERASLNAASPKGENAYKISVNDFILKAAAMALMRVPEVNASWTDTAILRHKHADIGVAVAIDAGLITPIVFRAEEKGLAAISNEVKSLAARAKEKKLKPQEYEGGSFSVSNLGMLGVKHFSAIINPPQAAILAVGAGDARPVAVNGKLEIATVMTVTLSLDHRVADGATGARFLQVFKQFVEEPAAMLL